MQCFSGPDLESTGGDSSETRRRRLLLPLLLGAAPGRAERGLQERQTAGAALADLPRLAWRGFLLASAEAKQRGEEEGVGARAGRREGGYGW